MFKVFLIIICANASMFCNYYPLDPLSCIMKTTGIMCQFSTFENACVPTQSTNIGCSPQLNKMACLNQLTNTDGSEAKCYFGKRCIEATETYLINLGCSQLLSRNACSSVKGHDCFWNGNECKEITDQSNEATYCSQVYNAPVTPSACAKIKGIICISAQYEGDYSCINIKDLQILDLTCDTIGLNEDGCVRITKQKCMFKNNVCFETNKVTSCNESMNRELCLSINSSELQCQWYKNKCTDMIIDETKVCEDYMNVSPSVCSQQSGKCGFVNGNCQSIDGVKCDDLGLSKESCLGIKNDFCTFINNKCEKLNKQDLSQVQCEELNEDACLNVTTQFQFCKWDGLQCVKLFVNQDLDCPLDNPDGIFKFNGNICQAISKPGVKCKYNKETKLCEKSIDSDTCETSYLNLYGCVNILNVACKWTDTGCQIIEVIQQITSCLDLGFANQVACSQILRSDEVGCYYDSNSQQCQFVTDTLLNELKCFGNGLNRIGCASILTSGQICRWYNNQCLQIKNKLDVQAVYCLQMQYVNPAVCALIEAGKEVCRYENAAKGCVNSLNTGTMTCSYPGLNSYACAQIQLKSCYYDKILWQCKPIVVVTADSVIKKQTDKLLYNSDCISSSPTPDVCRSITKPGEKCIWLTRENRCSTQYVTFNESCLDYNSAYTGKTILVNANVCASIEMEQPDYDAVKGPLVDKMKGYCIYEGGNCNIFKGICITSCCTEFIGINSHVCGKYSTGYYCYFGNDLRCTELTMDIVDTSIEKQVKDYYNTLKLKCSSMNKNSCHMIEWSTSQKCYFNGSLCVNVNFNMYPKLSIFTADTAILNKYACLSIEAMITKDNTLKKFGYEGKHCKTDPTVLDTTNCESTELNSNACQTEYKDIYCRWSKQELKCKNLDSLYVEQLTYCDQYVNEYACVNIPNAACFFSYLMDKCVDAPKQVECKYFDSKTGTVSRLACMNITLDGQICGYDDQKHVCKEITTESDSCSLDDGNSIACYAKTKGDCRWNSEEFYCYENDKPFDLLGCEDNVNIELCLKITSQPCEWDILKMRCLLMKSNQASLLVVDNLYNAEACVQAFGEPYYYDPKENLCIKITPSDLLKEKKDPEDPDEPNILCDGSQILNVDACLFSTLLQKCYFDQSQEANKRCQTFTGIQTSCESPYLISLQMCAEIPQSCYFVKNSYQCKYIRIDDTVTCSQLRDQNESFLYNKVSCSSINYEFAEYSGELQCLDIPDPKKPDEQFSQQCQIEKYCKWDQKTMSCQMMSLKSLEWKKEMQDVTVDGVTSKQEVQWCQDDPITYEDDCSNIFSKGACLQLSSICAFDIQMGGCFELSGNEKQVLSCEDIIGNNCLKSHHPNAPCMIDDAVDIKYPNVGACQGFPDSTDQICKQTAPAKCKEAQDLGQVSPIVCSRVSDNCYYDGTSCSSDTKKKKCNETFSQNACLSNGCDFTLGFCLEKFVQPYFEKDNPFYLYQCQYIAKLPIKAVVKVKICTQMDFPCGFINELCVPVAQAICSTLFQIQVSSKACTYCLEGPYAYDSSTLLCNQLLVKQNGCSNTNRIGCLSMTTGKNCAWINSECVEQSDSVVTKLSDCSLTNSYGCPKIQNACWVSPITNLCSYINVYNGCSLIAKQNGNQSACILSNLESCQWLDNKCQSYETTNTDCSIANKFGCLNLLSTSCGWSEEDEKCYQIDHKKAPTKCTEFFDSSKKLIKFNSYACQQIQEIPCFRDRTSKCNSIGLKDKIVCSTNGLNKLGCIINSTGYCQFINGECVAINDLSKVTCSSPINKVACFSLSQTCKFDNNQCGDYDVSQFTTLAQITKVETFPYSPSVCTFYTELEGKKIQLYYGSGSCVDANKPKPFIYSCDTPGLNDITCLKQTKPICQFVNGLCIGLTQKQIVESKSCDSSFNWNACSQLKLKCKFFSNKCQDVLDTESCLSLKDVIASPLTCSSRSQDTVACIFDSVTSTCKVSTETTLSCIQNGLNKYGCQMNTTLEFCRFNDATNICIATYETTLTCSHFTNENKCLFIKTQKQYCKFSNGCVALDPLLVVSCYNLTPTNPMTCTAAESIACKYNPTTQKCDTVPADMPTDEPWSNSVSFNKEACQKYQTDYKQVIYTTDGCLEVDSADLSNLTCDQPVNQYTCSQISNPTQFCIYKDYKCQFIQPTQIPNKACASIGYVNKQEYCEQATDVACKYNTFTKQCEQLDEDITACIRGVNKVACDVLPTCQFDTFCIEKTASCTGSVDCTNVRLQPCQEINGSCVMATNLDTLNCDQVTNKLACISISTPQQYCRFSQSLCQVEELKDFKQMNCEDIININTPYFCEQPNDKPCKFSQFENKCIESLPTDNSECIRGLNEYSCINYTKSALRCMFADFCFGPTAPMYECDNTLFDCCNKAPNQNTCLLQNFLLCKWDGSNCIKYTDPITTCETMQNTSKLTCIQSTENNCTFNLETLKCQIIANPTSCDQLQSAQQCQNEQILPCIWENNQCKYHPQQQSEECSDITQAFGSKRACLNVYRTGQMCQFLDGVCSTYYHITNECLPNINKVACVSQTQTLCQWQTEELQIKQTITTDPITVVYGTCQPYIESPNTICTDNLSYLSCLSITTFKQFCKWLNGKCIQIVDSPKVVTPNTNVLVNVNACALVNSEPVYYLHNLCVPIKNFDSITCNPPTPGLNMKACLSITKQRCKWNFDNQRCEFQQQKLFRHL